MIRFSKLSLSGFKSFVEKTEIDIRNGLTGIIGPNGCGKSNIVEGLLWVMGETSSRRMRSQTMDNVIFSGTSKRPARLSAKVSLTLDNSSRSAPAYVNNTDTIQIVRQIERDKGSQYYINGMPSRARDVNFILADTNVGSGSPAMVSQGKITNIISAKPLERRNILEESAGIGGLYVRRHEAELRLKASEENLARVKDAIAISESRLNTLKKQVRLAHNYKKLGDDIRQCEIKQAILEILVSRQRLKDLEDEFKSVEDAVISNTRVVSQLTQTANTQSAELPKLRQKEAHISSSYQAQRITLERLEAEEEKTKQNLENTKNQISMLVNDRNHNEESLGELSLLIEKLDTEEIEISERRQKLEKIFPELEKSLSTEKAELERLETHYESLLKTRAEQKAQINSLKTHLENQRTKEVKLQEKIDIKRSEVTAFNDEKDVVKTIEETKEAISKADTASLQNEIIKQQEIFETEKVKMENIQEDYTRQNHEKETLKNKIQALKHLINGYGSNEFSKIITRIKVDKGMESALANALGEMRKASFDENAPVTVIDTSSKFSSLPSLPESAKPLAEYVDSIPPEMGLLLNMTGVVESYGTAESLVSSLQIGQGLVTKDGHYFRWDGLVVKADSGNEEKVILEYKNELAVLEKQYSDHYRTTQETKAYLEKTTDAVRLQKQKLDDLLEKQSRLKSDIENLKNKLSESLEEYNLKIARISHSKEALANAENDLKETRAIIKSYEQELASLENHEPKSNEDENLSAEKAGLDARRVAFQEKNTEFTNVKQDLRRTEARLMAIGDERLNAKNRYIRAKNYLDTLEKREKELNKALEVHKSALPGLTNDRNSILENLTDLEQQKNEAADNLARAETAYQETLAAQKEAENSLQKSRENKTRIETLMQSEHEKLSHYTASFQDKYEKSYSEFLHSEKFDISTEEQNETLIEEARKLDATIHRLKTERDNLGPVNLTAENELQECEDQLAKLDADYRDLSDAVTDLKKAITSLNQEGRERLQNAFSRVDHYFKGIFQKLFDGGEAKLSLVESEDPLDCGLEIYAQPPGKSLQSLSLLSGGEQTMTALALIFSMFMANPGPLCVLDEVDAPLDDANVDRFCSMIRHISEITKTRFLIITHHRMTMARTDRLYGVTMHEKGVSQLVSVDMISQMDFLEAA